MKNKTPFKTFLLILTGWMLAISFLGFLPAADTHAKEAGQGVSGNDAPPPCTCEEKCDSYMYDRNCAACAADYKACAYKKPNVALYINSPGEWHREKAEVTFSVSDTAHTGNFELVKLLAKIGQSGGWMDVTEDKRLEISENCVVYVQATDQKGNTYERNRAIRCFDMTKPTLNAAVSDGLLSIQVTDKDSGVKTVYVNGYEFSDLTGGALNIRLQQFDAGYEHFTITAMDHAGNMSEVYRAKNPYYRTEADKDNENPAAQLPKSAEATKPGSAAAAVTEHVKTDGEGNAIPKNDTAESAKSKEDGKRGKEFYTIQTASEKVFYLIVDRDGEEETAYFLTEITENDLLNAVSEKSETLPKNSAALESAIPTSEKALLDAPEMEKERKSAEEEEKEKEREKEAAEEEKPTPEKGKTEEANGREESPLASYILIGGVAAAAILTAFLFKASRRKKEDFIDEDEEEEEEYGEECPEEEYQGEEGCDEFFEDFEEPGEANNVSD